jgi:hypothetical protein
MRSMQREEFVEGASFQRWNSLKELVSTGATGESGAGAIGRDDSKSR